MPAMDYSRNDHSAISRFLTVTSVIWFIIYVSLSRFSFSPTIAPLLQKISHEDEVLPTSKVLYSSVMLTKWSRNITSSKIPRHEYPRPTAIREQWKSLNGLWDYLILPFDSSAGPPTEQDFRGTNSQCDRGRIAVPFPVESVLSQVNRKIGPESVLWYHIGIELPAMWLRLQYRDYRILLHFGGSDWETRLWLNDRCVSYIPSSPYYDSNNDSSSSCEAHRGGYDSFTYDITDYLYLTPSSRNKRQSLIISVWDPTDSGPQPRGKQVKSSAKIWYTSSTGIWQTVWLELVPPVSISDVALTPDIDRSSLRVKVRLRGSPSKQLVAHEYRIEAVVLGKHDAEEAHRTSDRNSDISSQNYSGRPGQEFTVFLNNPVLWSPDNPFLYDIRISLLRVSSNEVLDVVKCYFGMRKVSIAPDSQGVMRIQLNNKFIFQYGLLDQGFWPDGLYTAPSDDALKADIEVAKKLGFNLLRKHVKVEPQRWYYWCDRLGMLVWQDMPSGDRAAHWSQLPEITRSEKSKACYERELKAMVDGLRNHPSIITWVPFNEGWGQYDTIRIINWTMQYDTSRLVDAPSGWNDFTLAGHMVDRHEYPGPAAPSFEKSRALVLGEFGGLGYSVVGHTWNGQGWSSNQLHTTQELNAAYVGLMAELKRLVESSGLSAAIYIPSWRMSKLRLTA